MGVVSGAVLEAGGYVTGVIPYAMVVAGGEKEQTKDLPYSKAALEALFDGQNRKNVRQTFLALSLPRATMVTHHLCSAGRDCTYCHGSALACRFIKLSIIGCCQFDA